jgi:hypothetical protein
MVSAKKALRVAKEAGEEMVTLYRGIPDWFPGEMVKEGKFISPQNLQYAPDYIGKEGIHYRQVGKAIKQPTKTGIYVGDNIGTVKGYSRPRGKFNMQTGKRTKPAILEFEVPKSWWDEQMRWQKRVRHYGEEFGEYWIDGGIPKEFLKKVHK